MISKKLQFKICVGLGWNIGERNLSKLHRLEFWKQFLFSFLNTLYFFKEIRKTSKCFKIELSLLPTQVVTLSDGQQLLVPVVVHQLCSFILKKGDTEGLFRKEGSKSRQNEIKVITSQYWHDLIYEKFNCFSCHWMQVVKLRMIIMWSM